MAKVTVRVEADGEWLLRWLEWVVGLRPENDQHPLEEAPPVADFCAGQSYTHGAPSDFDPELGE